MGTGLLRRAGGSPRLAIAGAFATLVVGLVVVSPVPALAGSVAVYVAYADSLRADATNFPTPWLGSPNTIFEGCTPVSSCTYDGGAIQILNTSGSAVTVDAVTVHIDTCAYTGWPSALLNPGASLIVTQLASGASAGCTGPTPLHFDTSDIGPGGSGYVDNCNPDGLQPTVDVTIDRTTTPYTDSGQVLNTGGLDQGSCFGNESIQWTAIGHAPCGGSLLDLAPATQSLPVLSTATVTATFTNTCGQPLANTAVDFAVSSGVNAGVTGSGVTDLLGHASFSYSSNKVGTDTLQASVTNLAGQILSNPASVIWTVSFAPGGGAFVISDLKDAQGGAVYWWGAQWWKQDHLSTGLAPASFKGYENGNATPWCGQTWTTRPGNSSRPPKAVAPNANMAVIVASQVTKRGPVISGNIVAVVLVRTNSGYGPNPGHPGTGTIITTLCSTTSAVVTPSVGTPAIAGPTGAKGPAVVAPASATPPASGTSGSCAPQHGKSDASCATGGGRKGRGR